MKSDVNPGHPLRYLLIGAGSLLLPVSCGPAYIAPPVTSQLAKLSRSPASVLRRGHEVHQAKCAKCHSFQDPARHDPGELSSKIMPSMAKKSKLDAADEKAVLEYLLAARKIPPQPPAP